MHRLPTGYPQDIHKLSTPYHHTPGGIHIICSIGKQIQEYGRRQTRQGYVGGGCGVDHMIRG
jgi:hypothetical protein